MIKAYVFDAYGTLFDVHSAVTRHAAIVGENPPRVSEIWRNKQLEYSWIRGLSKRYIDFWTITEQALDFALASVPGSNLDCKQTLLDAYMTLDCYAEVPEVLSKLRARGAKTAILSNGSPDMLSAAVNSAKLDDVLDDQFSVDRIGMFKTDASTYSIVTQSYGFDPQEIAFQSSNRWDIAGASAFGFQCNWINRTNQPDEYHDLPPAETMPDLSGLI